MLRIQDNESITCGFYCIGFREYMLIVLICFLWMTIKRMKKIYKHFKNENDRRSKSGV